ncbi:MAG: gamma carbonic anhydrase family protein [Cyanobacteria bacterium P01_C01_bin.72]
MAQSTGSYWSTPDLSQAAFVADNATVMGKVALGEGSSVWYGAIVRGDVEQITVGAFSNVQDGAILHGDPGQPTILEDHVTIGHRAVVHGAYVEAGCLIGIGAVILNGVRVGAGSIIGAGSVVTKDVPERSLIMGIPGRQVKEISQSQAQELIEHARKYAQLAQVHAGTGSDLGFKDS